MYYRKLKNNNSLCQLPVKNMPVDKSVLHANNKYYYYYIIIFIIL